MKKLFLAVAFLSCATFSHASWFKNPTTGEFDYYESDFTSKTLRFPNSTTLPSSCTVGDVYMDTDATSGQRIYACQSTDTWALQGDGTAAGGNNWTLAGDSGSALIGDTAETATFAGGTNGIDTSVSSNTITFNLDPTEVEGATWGAGGNASNVWTFNGSGTDTTLTLGSALWTISHGLVISGTTTIGTLAGAIDAGGATSLEIPNGASPTVNAAGEIAIDTTDDQLTYYGGAERVIPYTHEKCFSLETPVVGDDNVPIWSPNDAVTITSMYCRTQGGTSAELQVSDGTNACESIVCDSDGQADDGSIANGTFTANERMEFDTIAVTGSVTWVNYCIRYTYDRQ